MPKLTAGEKLRAKRVANNRLQAMVNSSDDPLTLIAAIAISAHAEFPQYVGHWNGWHVVTLKSSLTTKAGQAFVKGDVALRNFSTSKDDQRQGFCTLYSIRNGCDTSVPVSKVKD
ncbi:hypothetical protein CMI47_21450 [Candidatus Pacearchaeota archaeon]|jgi:hypothetical protein|nr:hypothetical protein [Candidatus Pacearchaeota archaeon]|tara:strand:- start:3186 stop:3530 length:345 start_codon:yes stop_codon:yes gene_type:complete